MARYAAAAGRYYVFVRYEDGWAILHPNDCRFAINRADPSPNPHIGRYPPEHAGAGDDARLAQSLPNRV